MLSRTKETLVWACVTCETLPAAAGKVYTGQLTIDCHVVGGGARLIYLWTHYNYISDTASTTTNVF